MANLIENIRQRNIVATTPQGQSLVNLVKQNTLPPETDAIVQGFNDGLQLGPAASAFELGLKASQYNPVVQGALPGQVTGFAAPVSNTIKGSISEDITNYMPGLQTNIDQGQSMNLKINPLTGNIEVNNYNNDQSYLDIIQRFYRGPEHLNFDYYSFKMLPETFDKEILSNMIKSPENLPENPYALDTLNKALNDYVNPDTQIKVKTIFEKSLDSVVDQYPNTVKLNDPYGNRIHPIYGDIRLHTGRDIAAPSGLSIPSPHNGKVVSVGWVGGYGNTVKLLDESGNYYTFYAHMKSPSDLEVGKSIKTGDIIGQVGSSGGSTGPHLHFEVRNSKDKAIEPTIKNYENTVFEGLKKEYFIQNLNQKQKTQIENVFWENLFKEYNQFNPDQ